jgi:hypothetical protein
MDNFENSEVNQNTQMPGETPSIEELSHTDKAVGIFTEPAQTYSQTAKFPPKTIDWFLPVLLLLILVAISRVLVLQDPEIYLQMKNEQIAKVEKQFNEMVEKGQMTREQADQQLDRVRDQFEMGRGAVGMIIQTVSILILGFIFFFIVTGIFFLFSKFALRGDGTYSSALVGNGLTAYISMVQIIIAAILSFLFGRMINDTSAASLMHSDTATVTGFVLAKIDPISIWSYIILSIGLAKMFKSQTMDKYFIMVFAVWILGSLLWFGIGQLFPFLQFG